MKIIFVYMILIILIYGNIMVLELFFVMWWNDFIFDLKKENESLYVIYYLII